MCTQPNYNTGTNGDLSNYVQPLNLTTFKEENDLFGLSLTLDELFSGYLDSNFCEADSTAKVDRFRDYLKIKELLKIIE